MRNKSARDKFCVCAVCVYKATKSRLNAISNNNNHNNHNINNHNKISNNKQLGMILKITSNNNYNKRQREPERKKSKQSDSQSRQIQAQLKVYKCKCTHSGYFDIVLARCVLYNIVITILEMCFFSSLYSFLSIIFLLLSLNYQEQDRAAAATKKKSETT